MLDICIGVLVSILWLFCQNIQKRATTASTKSGQTGPINKFVEDQLLQQGQALEHLVKIARRNQELTNTLIENLSSKVAEPNMPEKLEVHFQSRRSNVDETEHPIIRFGKNIPKYGNLFKDSILDETRNSAEPAKVLVEKFTDSIL